MTMMTMMTDYVYYYYDDDDDDDAINIQASWLTYYFATISIFFWPPIQVHHISFLRKKTPILLIDFARHIFAIGTDWSVSLL
jgi:hypothetical protein